MKLRLFLFLTILMTGAAFASTNTHTNAPAKADTTHCATANAKCSPCPPDAKPENCPPKCQKACTQKTAAKQTKCDKSTKKCQQAKNENK